MTRDYDSTERIVKIFPIQNVGGIPWSLAERAYKRYANLYKAKEQA